MRLLKLFDRLTNNAMDEWTADQMEHYKRTGKAPSRDEPVASGGSNPRQ